MKKLLALIIIAAITVLTATTAFALPDTPEGDQLRDRIENQIKIARSAAAAAEGAMVRGDSEVASMHAGFAADAVNRIKKLAWYYQEDEEVKAYLEEAQGYADKAAELAAGIPLAPSPTAGAAAPAGAAASAGGAATAGEAPAAGAAPAAPGQAPVNPAAASFINDMMALTALSEDFPELSRVFAQVNAAILQVVSILSEEEVPVPVPAPVPVPSPVPSPVPVPAPTGNVDVDKYIAETDYWVGQVDAILK